jgi:hypothetical protein
LCVRFGDARVLPALARSRPKDNRSGKRPGSQGGVRIRVALAYGMRLDALPGWVVDNASSVREEAAPFARMTMAERWEATRRCCEAASVILGFHRNPAAALAHRDALPEHSVSALCRLRKLGPVA